MSREPGEKSQGPQEGPPARGAQHYGRAMSPEDVAESIDEARAAGRPRHALLKQFLAEAVSPDAFGLSAVGAESAEGLEWLWLQYVQNHPADRRETVRLVVRPVLRGGRLYLEAARFDRENDPSGRRAVAWEDEIVRRNREEVERLRGSW